MIITNNIKEFETYNKNSHDWLQDIDSCAVCQKYINSIPIDDYYTKNIYKLF